MNEYTPADTGHVPPGWDESRAFALPGNGDDHGGYYDYVMSENGRQVQFGSSPQDYSTDVLTRMAVQFIQSTPTSQPLFLSPRARRICRRRPPRGT